jgi:hypothetical protein
LDENNKPVYGEVFGANHDSLNEQDLIIIKDLDGFSSNYIKIIKANTEAEATVKWILPK